MSGKFRRILAVILAVLMAVSIMPISAFAATAPTSITVASNTGVKVITTENGTLSLSATVAPEGADSAVTWMSSNSQIASVDANGTVTAKDKNGTVLISAISTSDATIRGTYVIDVAIPGNFYNVETIDESLYSYTSSSATNYVLNPLLPIAAAGALITLSSSNT